MDVKDLWSGKRKGVWGRVGVAAREFDKENLRTYYKANGYDIKFVPNPHDPLTYIVYIKPKVRKGKVPIRKVEILWKEGLIATDDTPRTFRTLAAANKYVRKSSTEAPKTGGYNKHGFRVTWADGNTYEGRLDVKHYSLPDNDTNIATHMRRQMKFIIESDPVKWRLITPAQRREAKRMLTEYKLE